MKDTGAADPRLAGALEAYDGTPRAYAEVLAALAGARVFVAIAAKSTAEHIESGSGLRAESSAEMALLSLLASDGQRAVPAFADTGALTAWRPEARPVPVSASYLARAAIDDDAAAIILDPDRAAVVVFRSDLTALADGYLPVSGSGLAVRRTSETLTVPETEPDPELVAALAAAVGPECLRAARLLQGHAGPVLGVVPTGRLDAAELAALAQRIMVRLGSALPPDGLDLAVVPTTGPGYPLPLRSAR